MARNSWRLFTLCSMLAVGHGLSRQVLAAGPDPLIAVRLVDENGQTVRGAARAQALATEIYQHAGVTLLWADDDAMAARTLTVVLATSSTAPAGLSLDAMGVAPSSAGDGARGTIAYVFTDRVAEFAVANKLAPTYVLACALAHEIGHLLLPPNAHSDQGIMRSSWHPALFPPKTPGLPGFSLAQARLLRLRTQEP